MSTKKWSMGIRVYAHDEAEAQYLRECRKAYRRDQAGTPDTDKVQLFPLEQARFCVNCEVILNSTGNCPACGSTQVFWLINWIPSTKLTTVLANLERKAECQTNC